MVTEIKNKNWFRKHWIISIFLVLSVIGSIGTIFEEDSINTQVSNQAENKISSASIAESSQIELTPEKIDTCTPDWDCGSWSKCSSSEVQNRKCTDINSCGILNNKPSISRACTHKAQEVEPDADSSSGGWMEDLSQAMEEMEETLNIYDKLDECSELCAGESADIPYVKNECYSACNEIYYYAGEEALDNFMEGYRN